ncbi:YIEGIA family protein [Brevibacillus daliensis]|uniref:YIEGIA family protein n=1 Tax=Brevibacillus daliensis TaxID=2892995 RepID=UPI001E48BBCA|nr:YIEGIA family protein [Brevibacillus daliensis]
MLKQLLTNEYVIPLFLGVAFGIINRIYLLRTDYRQYPTYPHGQLIHISLGVIAAGLGAVAVPSFLKEDYTAITFLSLAAQQFRDVRNMERNTLTEIDQMELVPRGKSYIEGIAMVFEGRNYLVIFSSFLTTFATVLFTWKGGIIVGIVTLIVSHLLKSGKTLEHIVDVIPGHVRLEGVNLYVDDIYIMNVGSTAAQDIIAEKGVGYVLIPKNDNAKVTIAHPGQRQAILHDASTILGVYTDQGEPSLTPLVKRDLKTGRLGVFLLPYDKDITKGAKVIEGSTIIESSIRMPQEAKVNQAKGRET